MEEILRISHLSKKYGKVTALNDVSYAFSKGIYGLLGPNGAGKTTFMNLLTTNLTPNDGDILFCGEKITHMGARYLQNIGYAPQQQQIYKQFTGEQFLYYIAGLKGISGSDAKEQISHLLECLHLMEYKDLKIGKYSGGMKQRTLLAQALIGDPRLLILDEITAGVDPKERIVIRDMIEELSKDKVVIFATHIVSDIEKIADHLLFLKKGVLLDSAAKENAWKNAEVSLEDIYMQFYGDEE